MNCRDKDIKKLYNYAKSLGIEIKKVPNIRLSPAAAWNYTDIKKPIIEIRDRPYRRKTTLILILLHELGHHLDWIHNNKKISEIEIKAHILDGERNPKQDPPIGKKYRKAIYDSEVRGIYYIDIIAKELDLSLPMWKIRACQEFDIWLYKMYLKTGNETTAKEQTEKDKELRKKHYEN